GLGRRWHCPPYRAQLRGLAWLATPARRSRCSLRRVREWAAKSGKSASRPSLGVSLSAYVFTRHRRLLRARCARQRDRRAAEQRDELALVHSITSSAATCSVSGTLRPSVFAIFRLITSSNLVGCRTGNSAGLSPLRIAPA